MQFIFFESIYTAIKHVDMINLMWFSLSLIEYPGDEVGNYQLDKLKYCLPLPPTDSSSQASTENNGYIVYKLTSM